ncbi:hypothetical protein FNV43_RR22640 [Rhamnella rubrinervis]|uniref:Uncharacterized protein n=1 Tax=Rhamnella rubrinervis TaxID=2594499 RepID=A0A8K0GS86_9ROSA|nr:hypothetical protein FNV43_RR22640 [Rhamnella rubrinervis]
MMTLSSGVLVKLLEEMRGGYEKPRKNEKCTLLQIRSIIPVMAESDLWPKEGFYLKVSDSSHAIFVSLPQEQDELVLCNKLQLGQFMFVEKIEPAHPVPVLRGIKPIPGRHPCVGDPEDLVAIDNFTNTNEAPDSILVMEKVKVFGKTSSNFVDRDCDSAYKIFSLVCSLAKRRSWHGPEISNSSVKHGMKPTTRSRSACASPVRCIKCDSSDESTTSESKRNGIGLPSKSAKTSIKSRTCSASMKNREQHLDPTVLKSSDKKWAETKILWNSLPSNLEKLGKEVLRHRDIALLASIEALQEASVAERLLKCLSVYSEIQSSKGEEPQPSVNMFLNLQEDLADTRLLVQKQNATLWIKAALASDLTLPSVTKSASIGAINPMRKPKTNYSSIPKGSYVVKKQKNNNGGGDQVAYEKENSQDWMKGSGLSAADELTNCLHYECKRWFLGYAENYLDEVKSKTIPMESSSVQVAEMMSQIKKVSDWLDVIVKEDGSSFPKSGSIEGSILDESEIEACRRVRSKIYGVLLKNVERTAMAWEHMNAMVEVGQQLS